VQDFALCGLHRFVHVLQRCRFVHDKSSKNGVLADLDRMLRSQQESDIDSKHSIRKYTLKRDREGSCVSRGSGTTPEYAMHFESVSVQTCYRLRLAEL